MASVYTYISRVKSPQNVCLGLLKDSSQAQAGTRPLRHKADKFLTDTLKLCLLIVRC